MKKLAAFLALIILVMSVCTVGIGETETPENRGKVVVLATGGTIAGVGDPGKIAGYKPGTLTAEVLLWGVPEIDEVADIEVVQVCNVNSDDITAEIWLELANTINQMAEDPDVKGFVITHGTDTMEETAYFLNLTVKTDKPVVLTGAMRPATALSADGPMNLYESVCVAASAEAVGHGVLIVFSDRIYAARTMKKHTTESAFDISGLTTLPKVSVLYFSVDADPELLRYAAEHSDGLVIAGAGAGEFSEKWIEIINELTIPVIISSRIDDGVITKDNLLCKNTVAANTLPPQKAAILLRLALTGETSQEQLEALFEQY